MAHEDRECLLLTDEMSLKTNLIWNKKSDDKKSDDNKSDDKKSDDNKSDDNKSDDNKSDDNKSDDNKSDDNKSDKVVGIVDFGDGDREATKANSVNVERNSQGW